MSSDGTIRSLKILTAVVLFAAFAVTGCGKPAATKAGESSTTAGMEKECVGMGCEGNVSAGLEEKCVGMGCPDGKSE